jgi:hypothetical protein
VLADRTRRDQPGRAGVLSEEGNGSPLPSYRPPTASTVSGQGTKRSGEPNDPGGERSGDSQEPGLFGGP